MNAFFFFFLIALISAMAWTILLLIFERQNGRWMGLIGAWAAVVVLGAIWQAEAIAWLWIFLKAVLAVWFGAIVFLIVGTVSTTSTKPVSWPILSCALISTLVNVAAGLYFLWEATVSGGGV
ncbi:MAG: hypothetical protein P1U85_09955 [Verrucomicrobiales bacterium]|nr:hypothetical protein [Verrucomicrobiales bacterium]